MRDPSVLNRNDLAFYCSVLMGESRFSAAEALLTQRLHQRPKDAWLLYLLGISLLLQERLDEAQEFIDAAFEIRSWLPDFRLEFHDIRPSVRRAVQERPNWTWARYELERHAFLGVGLTFQNAVDHSFSHSDVYFVEIGANDGRSGDPILPNAGSLGWSGLLVEPQPEAFARLGKTYEGNPNVHLVNAAIGERNERRILYFHPDRPLTLASFVPDRNVLAGAEGLDQVEVEAITFEALFERYGVTRVDILQMDTEGYDYQILKGFDFSQYHPKLINMEFYCLPLDERIATFNLLRAAGYAWRFHKRDLLAFDRKTFGDDFHIIDRSELR